MYCDNYVDEVNRLINILDISGDDATEIINIYFEFFADACAYTQYIYENIRIIRDTEENQMLIAEIETIDDACIYNGDDYIMITNYKALLDWNDMEDVLPNPFY